MCETCFLDDFSSHWYCQLRKTWEKLEQQPHTALLVVLPITAPLPPGAELLSEEEERKKRYCFLRDRQAYALGRLLVRWLLLPSSQIIPFSLRDKGKPYLPGHAEFNLSHGGGVLAVLLSRKGEVGVDVEAVSGMENHETWYDLVCHPNEKKWIQNQNPTRRAMAFLKCWTRKEAVLKALGQGISGKLTAVDTKLDQVLPDPLPPSRLKIRDIQLPYMGMSCSVAIPSTIHDVRTFYYISSKL